jgi:hypothetical protein
MKKITFLLIAFAQGSFLLAQNTQQKEAEVRAVELVEAQAVLQKNIAVLQKIWSPGFMVNSPLNTIFTGGQVELVQAGIISYTSFTRTIEQVMVLKDVVITMGSETVVPTPPDPMAGQTVQRRFTNIWSKEKGDWVLVARHANNICPATTPTGVPEVVTNEPVAAALKPSVRLNPSATLFRLDFAETTTGKTSIKVTDSNGRLVEKLELAKGAKTITFGSTYQPGFYFADISNGKQSKTVKLVKL